MKKIRQIKNKYIYLIVIMVCIFVGVVLVRFFSEDITVPTQIVREDMSQDTTKLQNPPILFNISGTQKVRTLATLESFDLSNNTFTVLINNKEVLLQSSPSTLYGKEIVKTDTSGNISSTYNETTVESLNLNVGMQVTIVYSLNDDVNNLEELIVN